MHEIANHGQIHPFIILAGCVDGIPYGIRPGAVVFRFPGLWRRRGLGIEVAGVDEQATGSDERLRRFRLADTHDEESLFPDSRCQTGEIAVARDVAEAAYGSGMQPNPWRR